MFESRLPARTPESIGRPLRLHLFQGRVAAFILAVFISGCASRQDRNRSKPTSAPPPAAGAALVPVATTPAKQPPVPVATPTIRPSTAPPENRSAATAVSDKLASSFVVVNDAPDTLRVSKKNSPPAPAPSLFEESILLGKIRGVLSPTSSRGSRPATFKRGVAAVSIPSTTPPGTAALAIAKILALEGVSEVRAEFPSQ